MMSEGETPLMIELIHSNADFPMGSIQITAGEWEKQL